jgi:transcriptional adapter 2-alpha
MLIRELLLLEGIGLQGMGNWQAISEHVGTRTKAEVEEHYRSVFINSPDWPLPVCSTISFVCRPR